MLKDDEILCLCRLINNEIDYYETCDLPDGYCEIQISKFKNLRIKLNDLLQQDGIGQ